MPSSASSLPDIYTLSLHDALPICPFHPPNVSRPHPAFAESSPAVAAASESQASPQRRNPWAGPLRRQLRGQQRGWLSRSCDRSRKRSEEHTSELQSLAYLVCRLLLRPSPTSTLFPYTTLFRSARFIHQTCHARTLRLQNRRQRLQQRQNLRLPRSVETHGPARSGVSFEGSNVVGYLVLVIVRVRDRKSTRLNSSH